MTTEKKRRKKFEEKKSISVKNEAQLKKKR